MDRTMKAAFVIVSIATTGATSFANARAQSLHSKLDQVVQSWQTGWIADPPVESGVPPSQWFRWRKGNAVLTVDVREMADAATALADVDGTPSNLSMGAVPADAIGDRAYVAGVPGGFTNVYVAVGNHKFVLWLHEVPEVAKSLAREVASVIKNYYAGSEDPTYD